MHVIDKALLRDSKNHGPIREGTADLSRTIRTLLPKSRRFVFGDRESEFVGKFIRDFGDVLLANHQFAIPPFENSYVEFDIVALLRGIGRPSSHDHPSFSAGRYDVRHGFVIDKNHVFSATEDSSGEVMISPLHFYFHSRAETDHLFSGDREEDDWGKLAFCLGTTLHDIPNERTRLEILNSIKLKCRYPKLFTTSAAKGFYGEIRNLLALLLVLNKRSAAVRFEDIPPKGVIYKGKRQVFMAHSIVKILLDENDPCIRAFTGLTTRDPPRRHQVRGFFRDYHKDQACEHAFPVAPNDRGQWICPKCATIRVWVKNFERGDASKGYVTKEYLPLIRDEQTDGHAP